MPGRAARPTDMSRQNVPEPGGSREAEPTSARLVRGLWPYRHVIAWGTVFATVVAAAVMALLYTLAPPAWTGSLEIRLVFDGAETGNYPNGTPFLKSDINNRTLVDQIFDQNHVEQYCDREDFHS